MLIQFETAKLAKEKRFDLLSREMYASTGQPERYNDVRWRLYKDYCSAPTQTELQKWLREVHGYHIEILLEDNFPYTSYYFRVMKVGQYFTLSHHGLISPNYEDVLESAIIELLKTI